MFFLQCRSKTVRIERNQGESNVPGKSSPVRNIFTFYIQSYVRLFNSKRLNGYIFTEFYILHTECLMILTQFCYSDFARRIFRRHIEPVLAGLLKAARYISVSRRVIPVPNQIPSRPAVTIFRHRHAPVANQIYNVRNAVPAIYRNEQKYRNEPVIPLS